MTSPGSLVDWLEERGETGGGPDFLSGSGGVQFGLGFLRAPVREKLRSFASQEIEKGRPSKDQVLSLARQLFYCIPVISVGNIFGYEGEETTEMTPEISTTIAFRYLDRFVQESDEKVDVLEDELIERLLNLVQFLRLRQYFDDPDQFRERKRAVEEKVLVYRNRLERFKRLYRRKDDLSFTERWYAWWNEARIRKLYARIESRYKKYERHLDRLRSMESFSDRFSILQNWIQHRDNKLAEAKQHRKFEDHYEELIETPDEQKIPVGISPRQEYIEMDVSEAAKLRDAKGKKKGAASELPSNTNGKSERQFPECLKVKEQYSEEEMEEIFYLINQKELELEDQRANIRSRLLAGDIQGAVRAIRRILSES